MAAARAALLAMRPSQSSRRTACQPPGWTGSDGVEGGDEDGVEDGEAEDLERHAGRLLRCGDGGVLGAEQRADEAADGPGGGGLRGGPLAAGGDLDLGAEHDSERIRVSRERSGSESGIWTSVRNMKWTHAAHQAGMESRGGPS